MPVSPATLPQHQDPCPQPQVKLCSSCRSPLSLDQDPAYFFPDSDASDHLMLCRPCKEHYLLQTIQQVHDLSQYSAIPQDPSPLHPHPPHPTNNDAPHALPIDGSIPEFAPMTDSSPSEQLSTHISPSDRPSPPKVAHEYLVSFAPSKRAKLAISTPLAPDGLRSAVSPTHSVSPSVRSSDTPLQHSPTPDPSVDITRLRVRSQGHHCLYPGATFQGTQKSGRNSYDVTVSIVDVDFSSSFLCGYLCIRGLTDDWPELTTYFDAEIIGSRYGFLTRGWGADEAGDMVHWARFPAFRHVKNKLKAPHLTMDGYPGAVFMRWKERFLVPDHRVQDINGASFAGFYYVCVDFNPHPQSPTTSTRQSSIIREDPDAPPPSTPKTETLSSTRGSVLHEENANSHRSPTLGTRGAGVATMSGFYFHQNSEPYQQLSLQHVPESVSTSFELR